LIEPLCPPAPKKSWRKVLRKIDHM
jgi:hypothetical protein